MFILADQTSSIEAVMGAAVDTTAPSFVVAYADHTTSSFTPGSQDGVLNGTTELDIVDPPAASTQREVKNITIYNADAVGHEITITFDDGTNERHLGVFSVGVGQTLYWSRETGWLTLGSNQVSNVTPPGWIRTKIENNTTDATNDIDVVAGSVARDDTDTDTLILSSLLTKRLDAAWAVGSGNGGLDTGAVANDTYHMFLIKRSDTGVVDALFSLSPTAPTMPANYDLKRRIGSFTRASGANLGFLQFGDRFIITAPTRTWATSNPGTSAVLQTLTPIPTGIKVEAQVSIEYFDTSLAGFGALLVTSPDQTDQVPTTTEYSTLLRSAPSAPAQSPELLVWTNTSAQIRYRVSTSNADVFVNGLVKGWIDDRGLKMI